MFMGYNVAPSDIYHIVYCIQYAQSFILLSLIQLMVTHWARNNMAAIFQTTFRNWFLWIKIYEFQWTIFQYWFRHWVGADPSTNPYLNQRWLEYRSIYASPGLNELRAFLWIYVTYIPLLSDCVHCSAVQWVSWRPKSSATKLFLLQFVQSRINGNIKGHLIIETVSTEGTFCDTVQVPSGARGMELT